MKHKIKYSSRRFKDEDRPRGVCYDCELPYEQFPCDMIIQDDLWELINPTFHPGAGILCPNCICGRLMLLPGMCAVITKVNVAESTLGSEGRYDDAWRKQ